MHLPVTAGYYEDRYFRVGDTGYPVVDVAGTPSSGSRRAGTSGSPRSRGCTRSQGAEVIVYPTAIGSEPDHPGFDTEPLWEQVIRANGIANGTFMVVPNRIGTEGPVTFYGCSFISDPYGRVLVQAPRDEPAVLVADLDLDQRRDWLDLFPFLRTRRPSTYGPLLDDVERVRRFDVPISEQISCMECGGTAVLLQLPADDEMIEAGDVLMYRCPDCGQRWDVVVDEDDVDADDA